MKTLNLAEIAGNGPTPDGVLRVYTLNSVYEVDHTAGQLRVRRLEGVLEPTPRCGVDGEWQDAEQVTLAWTQQLIIQWGGVRHTITSHVQRIEHYESLDAAAAAVSPAP